MDYEENGIVFDKDWFCDSNGIWTLPCLVFGHRANFHINSKLSEEEERKGIEKMAASFFLRSPTSMIFDVSAYELWRSQAERGRSFEKFACFTDMHDVLMEIVKEYNLREQIPSPKILLIDTYILQKAVDSFVGEERVLNTTRKLDALINDVRSDLQEIMELRKKQG